MQFTLTQEQYEALVVFAREGATQKGEERVRALEEWLRLIEKQNNVTRSFVLVQWQELSQPLPAGTFFPTKWPPELRRSIELVTRPVARADVDKVLAAYATSPTEVLCTRDPAGVLGWTPIDQFFVT